MSRLALSLLGPFQLILDGRPVTEFESAKVRALLAAEAGRTHPREAIAELLWPERPPGTALADLRHTRLHVGSLHGNLAVARRQLEEALSRCVQPGITHTNPLPVVLLELGHTARAEQDWQQARRLYAETWDAAGCTAAQTQAARAGLAEVAWAEHDKALARRLLTDVIDEPATAAATRRSAQQMLVRWELLDELDELVRSSAWSASPKPVFDL